MTVLRGPVARVVPAVRGPAGPEVPALLPAGLRAGPARVGLHLVLAGLPLLAISAHVFGLVPMHLSAALLVVPLALTAALLAVFAPAGEDRVVFAGAAWGVVATVAYDVVRFDTVYLLGWWGDFIPTMGGWVLGHEGAAPGTADTVVGYLWRYLGDGGGIGIVFFVLAAATGLWRCGPRTVVGAAVVFAVVPVWAGLIGTVALAPGGQQQMFPLTPTTVALSLLGHLVFGVVLGLGAVRAAAAAEHWPWAPLVDLPVLFGLPTPAERRVPVIDAFLAPDAEHTVVHTDLDHPRPGPSRIRSFEGRIVERARRPVVGDRAVVPDPRRPLAGRPVEPEPGRPPADRAVEPDVGRPGDGWGPWTGEHPDTDDPWAEPPADLHGDQLDPPTRSRELAAAARGDEQSRRPTPRLTPRRSEWDRERAGWPTAPTASIAPFTGRAPTTPPRAWSPAGSAPPETSRRRPDDRPPPDADVLATDHRPDQEPWDDPESAASWRPRTAAPPPRPEPWPT